MGVIAHIIYKKGKILIECPYCGKEGHLIQMCPKKDEDYED